MHIHHEVCLDCSTRKGKGEAARLSDIIVAACGHGPTCKLKADTPEDTVHGRVTIAFCDTVTLAEPTAVAASIADFERRAAAMGRDPKEKVIANDIVRLAAAELGATLLVFQDEHLEVATAENVADYWRGQGVNADGTPVHRLEKIVGNKAYGNTVIDVGIYEEDVPAGLKKHPWIPGALLPSTRKSTLKRPSVMPTADAIKSQIDAKMRALKHLME